MYVQTTSPKRSDSPARSLTHSSVHQADVVEWVSWRSVVAHVSIQHKLAPDGPGEDGAHEWDEAREIFISLAVLIGREILTTWRNRPACVPICRSRVVRP